MFSLLLASALTFTHADATLSFSTACRLVAGHTPRDAGTAKGKMAANFLYNTIVANGANAHIHTFTAPTPVGMKEFCNVEAQWCVNPTGSWVVVVSHYDTKPFVPCPGANDGASTSGLLMGLVQALVRNGAAPGNVMLMWLDGEECMYSYSPTDGLWGSKEAAKKLKASGRQVEAVICVDMLGDADLKISLPRNTSAELRRIALDCAKRTGHGTIVEEMRESVKDDHLPFQSAGYKAIDLIDFEYGSAPGLNDYWHTSKDSLDKLSIFSLATAGEIVCEMINTIFAAAEKNDNRMRWKK